MQLKLKKLQLTNFKGVQSKEINFTDTTFIHGRNATGKTTLFDSFLWLLFGKDSDGRTDFGVKRVDENGNTIPKQEVEVYAVIEIDGIPTEFKRVLREKWVKKKGSTNAEFTGNETVYFIDDLPLKLSEYQQRISELINENLFRLITSPTAFNGLNWKDQRQSLISISGGIESGDIIEKLDVSSDNKQELINLLAKDSNIENHKKTVASKIKKANDELKMIPTRIDEVLRSIPEVVDFNSIRANIANCQSELELLEETILNKSKAFDGVVAEINELKSKKYNLENQREELEYKYTKKAQSTVSEIEEQKSKLIQLKSKLEIEIRNLTAHLQDTEKNAQRKRNEWHDVNDSNFVMPTNKLGCPTCQRPFEDSDIEVSRMKLEGNFNQDKAQRLGSISSVGRTLSSEIKETEQKIKERKEGLQEVIENLEKLLVINTEVQVTEFYNELILSCETIPKIKSEIEEISKTISWKESNVGKVDGSLIEKKKEITTKINELRNELRLEEQIKKANQRVEELKVEEKNISQSISSLERVLNLIDTYNNSMVNSIEENVNSLFENVRFKMFETQINGGLKETCICTVSGVNYQDLNTAMKVNSGLEIINVLNSFYNVSAPIFIDNRESVIELTECSSQIINLIVSEADKTLRVC